MYRNNKTSIIGIVITIIVLIILVLLTNINTNKLSGAENLFSKLVMPVQNGLTHLKNKIAKNDSFFENIDKLDEENKKLKEENSELQKKLQELEIIKTENATLRQYVNMAEKYAEYKTVPAYIINKDVSNLSETMIINAGKSSGIDVDMPVITEQGLVGYIMSVTENTAKVQPIIDPATNISGTITTSRDSVIVRGILRKQ